MQLFSWSAFVLIVSLGPCLLENAFAEGIHDDEDIAGPILGFVMGESLSFLENPLSVKSDRLGDWSMQGVATGMTFNQTNPVEGNGANYSGFSNAQVIVEKTNGPIRLFAQTGLYAIPMLGVSYTRAQPATETSFGYVPQAYVSFSPNQNWSLAIGKIPSMGGVESTFTYENINIQRGLLWVQTNSVSRGMQLNYENGPFSAAFTWNDGAYSEVYNWLGGLVNLKTSETSAYTFSWTGAVSGNATNTTATPLLQNNSQIANFIYQYTGDRWTLTPYAQYTYVPENSAIGINGRSETFGLAILGTYHVTPMVNGVAPKHHISVPVRFEYESTRGNSLNDQLPGGLMYGPGSSAWSSTITPTVQWGKVFARAEFGYVKVFNPLAGTVFGANGLNNNQTRVMLEAGLLY